MTLGRSGVPPGDRLLQGLLWGAVLAAGVVPLVADRLQPGQQWARPVVILVFFVCAVLRTAVAATQQASRRTLPLTMTTGLALFGTGALTLALVPGLGFPSVAEVFFASAYLCFTAYLVLDTTGRAGWDLRTLLETGVTAGGVVSAAVFVLVTPLAGASAGDASLLVGLVYPLSDIVLVTILVTQLATHRRPADRHSGLLLAGLVGLAAVDASLPLGVLDGSFSRLEDVVWAAALAALAESAARSGRRRTASPGGFGAPAAVAAGLCAVVVLGLETGRPTTALVHWPAVLTMVLSLGLLMSSLRDARSATEAQRLSRTDDLTGLANRRAVVQRLAASPPGSCALMLLDLNGFKAVNDAFGHSEGDQLLVQVGQRLRDALPPDHLVGRLGGDEFAVISHGCSAGEVTRAAESVLAAMRVPLMVTDLEITLSIAVGIAAGTPAGTSAGTPGRPDDSDLLRRADVAMYRAKAEGGGYRWYDARTDEFAGDRLHLIEELRTGIPGGELRVFFQPQVDAGDGRLIGVEALVRWQHPTRGLLAPVVFLEPARHAGLMLPLSLEVVRLCVEQAAAWAAAGRPLRMSLNVDPPELLSRAWVPAMIAAVRRADLDPGLFTVELTEELLVADPAGATEQVQELARHGIEVSIDDYGTGYSGLTWLQTLPIRELKLARPFVSQVLTDPRTRTIVESTVRLATQLDLRVVAEGVEDEETAAAVRRMGVALLQGYLVSPPLPTGALDSWRRAREGPSLVEEVPVGEVPVQEVPVGEVPVQEVPVQEVPVGAVPAGALPVRASADRWPPRHPSAG